MRIRRRMGFQADIFRAGAYTDCVLSLLPFPAVGSRIPETESFYAESRIARIFCRLIRVKTERMRKPDMNLLFVYNLPFRGIARMTQGRSGTVG